MVRSILRSKVTVCDCDLFVLAWFKVYADAQFWNWTIGPNADTANWRSPKNTHQSSEKENANCFFVCFFFFRLVSGFVFENWICDKRKSGDLFHFFSLCLFLNTILEYWAHHHNTVKYFRMVSLFIIIPISIRFIDVMRMRPLQLRPVRQSQN